MADKFNIKLNENAKASGYEWSSRVNREGTISANVAPAGGANDRLKLILSEWATSTGDELLGAAVAALTPAAPTTWDNTALHTCKLREVDNGIFVDVIITPKVSGAFDVIYSSWCAVPTEGSTQAQLNRSALRNALQAVASLCGHDTLATDIAGIDVLAL